ncbi:ABC transporter ATP-binding protein [Blastococcus tunisiensis]|uniref:ABC-2 type transport system ATP-binding protein n=1 Tax=Blastococcus tunisiensis TaxID=1798228 RepID=A0A1I2DR43_9ACTN|nr:ABC transporter ATP-binding protein [Blastococcus sp. DSM 46838]SFE83064.1 ABC-2 type transport system ATP-binding protein [Blastococcus sp. DSM 46838]
MTAPGDQRARGTRPTDEVAVRRATPLRPPATDAAAGGGAAPVLRLSGVTRRHAGRPVWVPVDLALAGGTLTVVTGPNGSGKTTLLRLAAGLLAPSSGTRSCAGTALYLRGGAGLRTAQTVRAAVTGTAALVGRGEAAGGALAALGLDALADRTVGTLSAGERVRATLAAALACRPAVLCLDEPTAALDEGALADLVTVLDAARADGVALLVATHQPAVLLPRADAQLRVEAGRVVRR